MIYLLKLIGIFHHVDPKNSKKETGVCLKNISVDVNFPFIQQSCEWSLNFFIINMLLCLRIFKKFH